MMGLFLMEVQVIFPSDSSYSLSEHCGDILSLYTLCSCVISVTLLLCIINLLWKLVMFPLVCDLDPK